VKAKVWIAWGVEAVVFAVLLFGAAGTVRWPAAWAYLVLFFGVLAVITRMLARHDPALVAERMKPPVQKGQPLWDKVIMSAFVILFPGWLIVMGLDAVRYRWSVMPVWLLAAGGAVLALAMWIWHRTFQENTFLAPVVKIQQERGHTVVSSGPYRIVRHPLYAGVLIFFPATALLLGSWWGVAAAIPFAVGLVARTALEDRELQRRLDGYPDYARRVPYRLIPRVW
jgi:protein-S-isoprenylcysteine O-methyltransferase Ste14